MFFDAGSEPSALLAKLVIVGVVEEYAGQNTLAEACDWLGLEAPHPPKVTDVPEGEDREACLFKAVCETIGKLFPARLPAGVALRTRVSSVQQRLGDPCWQSIFEVGFRGQAHFEFMCNLLADPATLSLAGITCPLW